MGPMTIMITGAAGYVGRACVAEARAGGHHVVAVVRLASVAPDDWTGDDEIEIVEADLSTPDCVPVLNMLGVDAVIHAAASLTGNDAEQERTTLAGTRNLLQAMETADDPPRLVLVSSMSVYSGMGLKPFAVVDETTPLEDKATARDAYCRAKLEQERITAESAMDLGAELRIMRVGAVYGPERLWNAHIGAGFGPLLLRLGRDGEIPLAHVDYVAHALIRAAETPVPDSPDGALEVLNVVEDDLPDRVRFLNAMSRSGWPKLLLPIPWRVFDGLAWLLQVWPCRPGLLRRETLRARMFPVTYPNTRLRARLGLGPSDLFERSFALAMGDKRTGEN